MDVEARRWTGRNAAAAVAVYAADLGVQLASAVTGSGCGHSLRSWRRAAGPRGNGGGGRRKERLDCGRRRERGGDRVRGAALRGAAAAGIISAVDPSTS